MNIEEIKKWRKGPLDNYLDASLNIDWLIAEHDRLTAENANLRATVRGKTMYHSDEDVNREMGKLRAQNERMRVALERVAGDIPASRQNTPVSYLQSIARQALKEAE